MKMKDDVVVKVQQLPHGEGLEMPFYATTHAAGADLRAAVEGDVIINQGGAGINSNRLCYGFAGWFRGAGASAFGAGFKTGCNRPQ